MRGGASALPRNRAPLVSSRVAVAPRALVATTRHPECPRNQPPLRVPSELPQRATSRRCSLLSRTFSDSPLPRREHFQRPNDFRLVAFTKAFRPSRLRARQANPARGGTLDDGRRQKLCPAKSHRFSAERSLSAHEFVSRAARAHAFAAPRRVQVLPASTSTYQRSPPPNASIARRDAHSSNLSPATGPSVLRYAPTARAAGRSFYGE